VEANKPQDLQEASSNPNVCRLEIFLEGKMFHFASKEKKKPMSQL
jgi:hypothetical protein